METVNFPLIVEFFELNNIFAKGEVSFFKAGDRIRALVDYPDAENEFAEVLVILVRKDTIEDTGTKAINIQKQFPCFITT